MNGLVLTVCRDSGLSITYGFVICVRDFLARNPYTVPCIHQLEDSYLSKSLESEIRVGRVSESIVVSCWHHHVFVLPLIYYREYKLAHNGLRKPGLGQTVFF